VLGRTHSKRIARAVKDVLGNTDLDREPLVKIGADMEAAIRDMRDFLWEHVYDNPTVHDEFIKCHAMLEQLFNLFIEQPTLFGKLSDQRVPDMPEPRRRMVCDFLAGMTDRYAIDLFKKMFIPRPWPVSNVGQG